MEIGDLLMDFLVQVGGVSASSFLNANPDEKHYPTYFAPGRINLIGEHLDYNGGLVLPVALNIGIAASFHRRHDGILQLFAKSHPLNFVGKINSLPTFSEENDWANYPIGVIKALQNSSLNLQAADLFFASNLPEGSGLSSSAAIEILTAFMFLKEQNIPIDLVAIAKLCQAVENNFIGVKCGIMDQFAVAMGKAHHAILLDCNTLKYEYIPFELDDCSLLILNSKKPRSLIKSAYNERKQECENALLEIRSQKSKIRNLVDAEIEDLVFVSDEVIRKRAKHVISEQLRVRQSVKALEMGDLHTFGRLMNASHQSLKEDYEVSGLELDTLAETAQSVKGCLGARMTGAGFGGCAIALVQKKEIELFKAIVSTQYKTITGIDCEIYVSEIGDGVRKIID